MLTYAKTFSRVIKSSEKSDKRHENFFDRTLCVCVSALHYSKSSFRAPVKRVCMLFSLSHNGGIILIWAYQRSH